MTENTETTGYAAFTTGKNGMLERMTSAGHKWVCPNCGETIRAHKVHRREECAGGDDPPKFWLKALLGDD
jgi:predicted RNA-binding Zn-ribbon protein involved in translation (DUF1610 family)